MQNALHYVPRRYLFVYNVPFLPKFGTQDMKMFEAARVVLADAGSPMHAKDIYAEIVKRDLYKFGAKNPISVLSQSLSERSVGNKKNREELFTRTGPGTYLLASEKTET